MGGAGGQGQSLGRSRTPVALSTETQMWICKPTASNQGKGIFLLRNQEEVAALQAKTQSIEEDPIHRKMPLRAPQARVVQRCWAVHHEGRQWVWGDVNRAGRHRPVCPLPGHYSSVL